MSESELYRYEEGSDKPAKDFDHALDALRYLIFKLDAKRLARKKWFWQRDKNGDGRDKEAAGGESTETGREMVERPWIERVRSCGRGFVREPDWAGRPISKPPHARLKLGMPSPFS